MIREGKHSDLRKISLFDEFKDYRGQEIEEKRLLVFELENYIVAYISLSANDFHGYPYIQFLCVENERRRTGIGNKLMDFVERRFVERRVFISTESWNEPMLNLLKKRGFQLSGKLHGLNKDDSDEVFFFKDIKVVEE